MSQFKLVDKMPENGCFISIHHRKGDIFTDKYKWRGLVLIRMCGVNFENDEAYEVSKDQKVLQENKHGDYTFLVINNGTI